MKATYKFNKAQPVGKKCICPSCLTEFVKSHYQQAFCKSKPGTECKDKYWNTVDESKRNNTTRISPAAKRFLSRPTPVDREFDEDNVSDNPYYGL